MSGTTKPVNQKAWFLILPVLLCVAFSAIIPLMIGSRLRIRTSMHGKGRQNCKASPGIVHPRLAPSLQCRPSPKHYAFGLPGGNRITDAFRPAVRWQAIISYIQRNP